MEPPRSEPQPPTPSCPICHRPGTTWHVCPGCVARVDRQLAELLDLHALANHPATLFHQRTGNPGPIGAHREPPLPLDLAALDLALGEDVLGCLEQWERWWREHWGLSPYGIASSARLGAPYSPSVAGLGSTATSRTLSGVVGFLRAWWPRASEVVEPPPGEFADEVRRLWSAALTAMRLQPERPWTVVCPTDGCGTRLKVEHDGRHALIRCPRCRVERTLANLLYVARADGRACWVDAQTAAHALGVDIGHLGPMVRDGRLRSRGERDCRQYDVGRIGAEMMNA